jgi:hypothetical protein
MVYRVNENGERIKINNAETEQAEVPAQENFEQNSQPAIVENYDMDDSTSWLKWVAMAVVVALVLAGGWHLYKKQQKSRSSLGGGLTGNPMRFGMRPRMGMHHSPSAPKFGFRFY